MNRIPPLLVLAALGLGACQTPPAPPPRATARPAGPPASPVQGAWSFGIVGDRCTARVTHRDVALDVTAGPGRRASLGVTAPGQALPVNGRFTMAFQGGSGWQLAGRTDAQRKAAATLALDDAGQGRLRDLLGGGTLRLRGAGVSAPPLILPDAGVSGRDWYGCVARLTENEAADPAR
ncbi:MAG: hypothetical protein JWR10_4370 [Rubritepida sp.]|nr:hypothetical protein [Rubritepida sp.]